MGTLNCGCLPLIYRLLVCEIFIKTCIIMYIFTNVHRPCMCKIVALYILLVTNFIDPNNTLFVNLINYLHQHID